MTAATPAARAKAVLADGLRDLVMHPGRYYAGDLQTAANLLDLLTAAGLRVVPAEAAPEVADAVKRAKETYRLLKDHETEPTIGPDWKRTAFVHAADALAIAARLQAAEARAKERTDKRPTPSPADQEDKHR